MLKGVKVLDLSRVLAGPLCTMMLGDMGAEVVKVERPLEGDETRGWGPPFNEEGASAYYLSVNRNKLGIVLDFDEPNDSALLLSLAEGADVIVENFRPGVLARRGLDAKSVRGRFPGLVWCTISGFPGTPSRPGYDFVVQAESGWMSVTGSPDGVAMKHGIALADVLSGKDAAIAILGALVQRQRTGAGATITITLAGSAEAALVNVAQNALVSGDAPRRWGNAHANLVPYELFEALDRSIVIAAGTDAQWLACAGVLGLGELAKMDVLRTNAGRVAQRDRVVSAMTVVLAGQTAAYWRERLDAAHVPNGVVRSVPEVLDAIDASATTGMPPSVPGSVRRGPPRLGEHTSLVRELGWSAFGAV